MYQYEFVSATDIKVSKLKMGFLKLQGKIKPWIYTSILTFYLECFVLLGEKGIGMHQTQQGLLN